MGRFGRLVGVWRCLMQKSPIIFLEIDVKEECGLNMTIFVVRVLTRIVILPNQHVFHHVVDVYEFVDDFPKNFMFNTALFNDLFHLIFSIHYCLHNICSGSWKNFAFSSSSFIPISVMMTYSEYFINHNTTNCNFCLLSNRSSTFPALFLMLSV